MSTPGYLRGIRTLVERAPRGVRISFFTLMGINAVVVGAFVVGWFFLPDPKAVAFAVLALALFVAVWVVPTLALLLGRGWARMLLTVLSVLDVAATIGALVAAEYVSPLAYAQTVVTVASVVLLWLPSSREFFRQAKADRAARQKPVVLKTPRLG